MVRDHEIKDLANSISTGDKVPDLSVDGDKADIAHRARVVTHPHESGTA